MEIKIFKYIKKKILIKKIIKDSKKPKKYIY